MSPTRFYFDLIVHNHTSTTNTNLTCQDRHHMFYMVLKTCHWTVDLKNVKEMIP